MPSPPFPWLLTPPAPPPHTPRHPNSSGSSSSSSAGLWCDVGRDRCLALLLALMGRCHLDPGCFTKYSLAHVVRASLGSDDVRERYYSAVYLLKHWMLNQQDKYWRNLRLLVAEAQRLNDERLLSNPYLQMCGMLAINSRDD